MKTNEQILEEARAARKAKHEENQLSTMRAKTQNFNEVKPYIRSAFPDVIFEDRFVILGGLKFFYYLDKTEIALGFKNETYDYPVPIRDMAGLADFLDRFIRHEEGQRKYKEKKEKSILFKIYQAFRKFFKNKLNVRPS